MPFRRHFKKLPVTATNTTATTAASYNTDNKYTTVNEIKAVDGVNIDSCYCLEVILLARILAVKKIVADEFTVSVQD